MCNCWEVKKKEPQIVESEELLVNDEENTPKYQFRYKCCLLWTIPIISIVLLTFFLILFFAIIPNQAQDAVNNSVMETIYMSLSNATNESILMNVTIQVENTGSYDAQILSINSDAYDANGNYIGTLLLPHIHVTANKGATFSMIQPLLIHNLTNFKNMTAILLRGEDTSINLKAKPTIKVKIAGMQVQCKVNMDHTMVLKGSKMQNSMSYNFTVMNTTNETINTISHFSFSSDSTMYMTFNDITLHLQNSDGIYIGYAYMSSFTMQPGYNFNYDVHTVLHRTNTNQAALENFLSNYMMGNNQKIIIYGPISTNTSSTVIDYTINTVVLALGSTSVPTAVSGLITSETQIGWTFNGTLFTGAYSVIYNALAVPLRLLDVTVDLFLWEPLEWDYDISIVFNAGPKGHCGSTTQFSRMHSGRGMYKDDYERDYVDVAPFGYATFFVWGTPQPGQFGYPSNFSDCLTYDFPCCFVTETLAAICRANPSLKNNIDNQLDNAYLTLRLESNMTIRLGEDFVLNITYNQAFFSVFFGSEIYQGYKQDSDLNCADNINITSSSSSPSRQ